MTKMIRVVTKTPGAEPVTTDLPHGLRTLQEAVGGYVEAPYIPGLNEAGITMWANEEGKILGLPGNFWIFGGRDFVAGPVIFTGHNDEGETLGLTDEQTARVLAFLADAPDAASLVYSL